MLAVGLALSAVVGVARGRLTPMWTEGGPDGARVVSKGTVLTIGLFLGLVAVKFALGTFAYFTGTSDGGGFSEVLFMIAIMVALQAQIMWHRAPKAGCPLPPPSSRPPEPRPPAACRGPPASRERATRV
jgi:hypothetical protein